jgi:hypothetical protein
VLLSQSAYDLLDVILVTLEHRMDRSIGKVADPAEDPLLIGEAPGIVAEMDSLNDASEFDLRPRPHVGRSSGQWHNNRFCAPFFDPWQTNRRTIQ